MRLAVFPGGGNTDVRREDRASAKEGNGHCANGAKPKGLAIASSGSAHEATLPRGVAVHGCFLAIPRRGVRPRRCSVLTRRSVSSKGHDAALCSSLGHGSGRVGFRWRWLRSPVCLPGLYGRGSEALAVRDLESYAVLSEACARSALMLQALWFCDPFPQIVLPLLSAPSHARRRRFALCGRTMAPAARPVRASRAAQSFLAVNPRVALCPDAARSNLVSCRAAGMRPGQNLNATVGCLVTQQPRVIRSTVPRRKFTCFSNGASAPPQPSNFDSSCCPKLLLFDASQKSVSAKSKQGLGKFVPVIDCWLPLRFFSNQSKEKGDIR